MKINNEKAFFNISRIFGLGIKALFVIVLNKFEFDSVDDITLYFISLQSLMIIYNNHSYFSFYKKTFDANRINEFYDTHSLKKYISLTIYHILLFYPISLLLSLFLTKSILLSLVFSILIILEKIFDELLRFHLFKKYFMIWSKIFIMKVSLPIILGFPLLIFFDKSYVFFLLLLLTHLCILLVFLDKGIFRLSIKIIQYLRLNHFFYYLKDYILIHFKKQLYSILTGNVIQIDKIFLATAGAISFLPTYYIMFQITNVINVFTELFYIAPRRSVFVSKTKSIRHLIKPKFFFFILLFGFLISYTILCVVSFFELIDNINFNVYLIYMFAFIAFCLVKPIGQYLFWNSSIKKQIFLELIYFTIAITLFIIFFHNSEINILSMVIIFLISNVMRLILYLTNFLYHVRKN